MTEPYDLARVLVVEDEQHLAAGLKLNFELDGYNVVVAESARAAASALLDPGSFDVIILDVMLPDSTGFELCRRLRDAGDHTPVLMLTASGTTDDRVRGLEAGADDYLVKPFQLEELLARVRSMLRRRAWERSRSQTPGEDLRIGPAHVDFSARTVHIDGENLQEIHLTQLEFDLLHYFANNANRVLTRQELQEKVWKLEKYPNSRMVDNFMLRLRKHFEKDPSSPRYFLSVRGTGYKFVPDEKDNSGGEDQK